MAGTASCVPQFNGRRRPSVERRRQLEFEVFYDRNEQHRILAEDVEDYLRPIYQSDAQFVIALLGPPSTQRGSGPNSSQTSSRSDSVKGPLSPYGSQQAPPGMFDESTRVGGFTFDPTGNVPAQINELADLLRRKIADVRGGIRA
jgi:hypothetical protein